MKDQLITFQTAKLAKEKGFDILTGGNCWVKTLDGEIIHNKDRHPVNDNRVDAKYYLAQPTQSLLQKWLREVHNIHIVIDVVLESKWHWTVRNLNKATGIVQDYKEWVDGKYTYEETLEKGLQEALKLI